jgi:Uma2 family endonuclease
MMTFAEFEQFPYPDYRRYELRHGEPFEVPPTRVRYFRIQQVIRDLLDQAAVGFGRGFTRFGFRTSSDFEYRIADIVYVSADRLEQRDPDDYFEGPPELVIEVLSPENTATEIADKKAICLENGCRAFWVVDITRRQIAVSTPEGCSITYNAGDEIPLFFGSSVAVDAIFAITK